MSSIAQDHSPFIVRFYEPRSQADSTRDDEGRTLDDILQFDDESLECHHDYIQVLFPLPERSPVNPYAPLITKVDRDAFLERSELRERLSLAFKRMVNFYGLYFSGPNDEPVIVPKRNFTTLARRNWLTRFDHNHLRITRIIRCLRILGLEQVALAFHQALQDNARGVSTRSLMYWERAVKRPLHLPPDEERDDAAGIGWLKSATSTV